VNNYKDQLVKARYVRVLSNDGIWEVTDALPSKDNSLKLKNTSSGFEGEFPIIIKGKSRIFPLQNELNYAVSNISSEDIDIYEDKPKLEKIRKRKRRTKSDE